MLPPAAQVLSKGASKGLEPQGRFCQRPQEGERAQGRLWGADGDHILRWEHSGCGSDTALSCGLGRKETERQRLGGQEGRLPSTFPGSAMSPGLDSVSWLAPLRPDFGSSLHLELQA